MKPLPPPLLERIKSIYIDGQTETYQTLCAQVFELPEPLQKTIEDYDYWLEPESPIQTRNWPSVNYNVVIPGYIEGAFHVEYRADIDISKLFPVYRLTFNYEIRNPDPEALGPSYWGFDEQAMTQSQMAFLEQWELQAQALGWFRLNERQCQSPLVLDKATAFPQESLWRHLAFDLLELCPD